jgi:protein-S-isoprenylcysteine O-methyltransferase Ste14
MALLKSILHNIGVVIVGFIFAFIGRGIDSLLDLPRFESLSFTIVAYILLILGFVLRVWATLYFYKHHMSVIRLEPQKELFTSGPYSFTRNPLYLGGNVFIFFGAIFFLGSPSGIILTIFAIVATDFMIRREERQLARDFGQKWIDYKSRVGRWL